MDADAARSGNPYSRRVLGNGMMNSLVANGSDGRPIDGELLTVWKL